ncbi:MAG: hypothetical protein ACRC14_07565 [Paracoccaceae bacterium]
MIGASKILTVSYGTFSCTLEGFDDPFNTMRAIAEYFRDLAAEDRYFGAEPPTPDAAMLHKIAEREIQRRVEAKIQDNGVILRAGEIDVPVSQPVVRPAVHVPALAAAERPAPQLAAAEIAEDDSVAARLARLREAQQAEVAQASVVIEEAQPAEDHNDAIYIEDQHADTLPSETVEVREDVEVSAEDNTAADTIASVLADLADETADVVDMPAATVAEVIADADVAEWVDDLRKADGMATDAIDAFAEAEIEETSTGAEIEIEETSTGAEIEETSTEAEIIAATSTEDLTSDEAFFAGLGSMIDPEGEDYDDDLLDLDDVAPLIEPAEVLAATDETTAEVATNLSQTEAAPLAEVAQIDTPAEATMPEKLQRARARVIKIRRIETTAAEPFAAPEALIAVVDPLPPVVTESATGSSALSPEAEAELQRELAALEIEAAPLGDLAVTDAEVEAEIEANLQRALAEVEVDVAPAPTIELPAAEMDFAAVADLVHEASDDEARKPVHVAPGDDAVNRLLSQTNSAMEGPENKRRLAAIAHLKAAVAATFADRRANPAATAPGPEQRMDPYREDLDRVVRPRRPALVSFHGEEVTQRPEAPTERPAPLVLVSEQRIDRSAPAATAATDLPVRPRRVTNEADAVLIAETDVVEDDDFLAGEDLENIFAEAGSIPFSEFADRLGATAMPDLLEAAAAYCTMVLGRSEFSRPLLMQQIGSLNENHRFGREDCLRAFGTLMRTGRITKMRRGQFRLSEQSHYLTEAKRLAG